jgi:hypothetical protein
MSAALGSIYTLAAVPPILAQIGLLLGKPWGHLTMGGRWQGALPPPVRPLAAVQASLLILMASVVLDHSGAIAFGWPGWVIWPVLGLTLLTTLGNLATPSRLERLFWGPMTIIMTLSLVGILVL